MQLLQRGQKMRLPDLGSGLNGRAQVRAVAPGLTIDFSCFGVDEAGQLSDDRYFVFYNQPASPEGALKMGMGQPSLSQSFDFDLSRLPGTIRRLVFTLTLDGAGEMSQLQSGHFLLCLGGKEVARFAFSGGDFGSEKALIVGEVYFKDVWRVAAVGQGFSGGLSALLKHFGGEEVEEAPPRASSTSTGHPSTSRATAPPIPPAPVPAAPPSTSTSAGRQQSPSPTLLTVDAFAIPPFSSRVGYTPADVCVRCGRGIGFMEKMRGFNDATRRCKACEEAVAHALEQFRLDFANACASGQVTPDRWRMMWERFNPTYQGVPPAHVLNYISREAMQFVDRLAAMAAADRAITAEEEHIIGLMLQVLAIPHAHAAQVLAYIEHVKAVARIRQGHLPVVAQTEHHLESGETCHLEMPATYHKMNARSVSLVSGKLLATSKKLHFLAATGGRTIQYKNIMRVRQDADSLYLELSTSSGHGRYQLREPLLAEAVITTLTRMAKRQQLAPQDERASRHIPQDVKNAVWQRDQGRCTQCGAQEYLEFDHIIPHSKGGASTLNNVQLLCRRCNLEKADRI